MSMINNEMHNTEHHNMPDMEHNTSHDMNMDMSMEHSMHMNDTADVPAGKRKRRKSGQMSHMGNLKRRFWISLLLAVPIILLSPMMGMSLPFQVELPGSERLIVILATILFFYGGQPFFKGAATELKAKSPAMMTLISMGISVAYIYSIYAFISNFYMSDGLPKMDFFWELATLIVIMLLGHLVEMRAVGKAGDALQKMAQLLPGSAHLMVNDEEIKEVPLQEIEVGQSVLVKAGEKIPADGEVVSGSSTANEAMLTGEAKDVKKETGSKVIGGSVNGDGVLTVRVTGTGESGYLSQVMKLVNQAQQDKSSVETMSDKVARALFYVALGAGILAFIIWWLIDKDLNIALERMVTVFIIACPHALGLAIPLVIARSTSLGASHGLLIRNRNALETAKNISVVCMDKTGTLTEGNFSVSDIKSFSDKWTETDILTIAAALETNSTHPLATGILRASNGKNLTLPSVSKFTQMKGIGLSGIVNDKKVEIVSGSYLRQKEIELPDYELKEQESSVSYILVNNEVVGLIAQSDQIKPEAKQTIANLYEQHIEPVMLTGDNEQAANTVARQLNITSVYAHLLPENKENIIHHYQQEHKKVMMVGDGVNDAPALVRADIGVAIGAGTDVAVDSADVILTKSNPMDIVHFLSLAKNTSKKMTQNLWWGAGYNIIAIPLAAGVLAPVGIVLSPAAGALLMSLSTIIVAINALTLKMR